MIKLLIVDDEAVIRQGLRASIRWEKYGITVIGEAISGAAALEKTHSLYPDIIISDIRMANGDGLAMTRRLLEQFPQVRIIFLSGYSEKEYMMEAIKLGVRDYLLKPAGTEQILEAVLKQRDEILLGQQKEQQNSRLENLINENIDTLKAYFLEELLGGRSTAGEIREKAQLLQIDLRGPRYALFIATLRAKGEWELLQLISSHLERYSPVLVTCKDGSITAILNVTDDPPKEEILSLASLLAPRITPEDARQEDSGFIPCCCGAAVELEELHRLYAACLETRARSVWFSGPCLWSGKDTRFEPLPEQEILNFERNIVQSIRAGNFTAMSEEINGLFRLFERIKPTNTAFKEILFNMARSIQVFSENNGLSAQLEELFSRAFTPEDAKETILSIVNNDYSHYGPQVRNALNFMTKNCAADLSLADAAANLYISPSYLTRLLKNKTGRGFNEWLHIIRIGKAKELLEKSDLRHYEIAEQVGYSSYKIFSEYFSRIVGCSARDYRRTLLDCGKVPAAPKDDAGPLTDTGRRS
jgi:YesN/AraC family two-component response regulator